MLPCHARVPCLKYDAGLYPFSSMSVRHLKLFQIEAVYTRFMHLFIFVAKAGASSA